MNLKKYKKPIKDGVDGIKDPDAQDIGNSSYSPEYIDAMFDAICPDALDGKASYNEYDDKFYVITTRSLTTDEAEDLQAAGVSVELGALNEPGVHSVTITPFNLSEEVSDED